MAETFGIATGIVTFLSTATVIIKAICVLVDDIKGADADVTALADELKEFEKVLIDLDKLADIVKKSSESTIREAGLSAELSTQCLKELTETQRFLNKTCENLAGGWVRRLLHRTHWAATRKQQIDVHTTRIAAQKGSLIFALGVLQSHCVLVVDEHIQQVHGQVKQVDTLVRASSRQTSRTVSTMKQQMQQSASATEVLKKSQRTIQETTSESLALTKGVKQNTKKIQQSLQKIDRELESLKGQPKQTVSSSLNGPVRVNLDPRNYRYFGRHDVFQKMTQELLCIEMVSERLRSFALHGMAGVGKTQTALEFAHREADSFDAILWVRAENEEKLTQSFVDIARALGLSEAAVVEDRNKSIASVQKWFTVTDMHWLLVFDNADHIDIIYDFWPIANKGAVIVTSQNPTSGSCLASRGSELRPLSESDAIAFTRHLLGSKSDEDPNCDLAQVPESLGFLPLAIDQMVSFIIETDCTVSSFQQMYKDRKQADELQDTPSARTRGYSKTVAATFGLSLDRLDGNARSTIECLAFFDPDQIPEDLLSDDSGKIAHLSKGVVREKIFKDLRSYTLIRRNQGNRTLIIHRLLRDAAIRALESNLQSLQAAFGNAVHLISQAFPKQAPSRDHMTEMWPACEIYVQHVISLHDTYTNIDHNGNLQISSEFVITLYNCSWYMFERGRFEISFSLAKTAETLYDKADFQDRGLLLADIYSVQGAMRLELMEMDVASELFKRAMRIREDAVDAGLLDPDHPNRANSYMNLGVSVGSGDPRRAIGLHQRALDIRERSSKYTNEQMQGLALNLLNLGRSLILVQQLDTAAQAFARCLSILDAIERQTGQKFALSAWALWSKGNIEIQRGNMNEAFHLHTRSMELQNAMLGPSHRKTAACYYKIAWFLHRQGDFDRATELLRQTLTIYSAKSGSDVDGHIARTKYKLAAVLHDAGQTADGAELKIEAQRIRYRLNGTRPDQEDSEDSYDQLVAYFYR